MLDLEKKLIADFDLKLQEIAKAYTVDYLNFTKSGEDYRFIDGHHLDYKSGQVISEYIASYIKNHQTRNL
jgi:predicted glycoside hydrolase/deacetylase ChbG (UPF0249 family)